MTKRAPKKKLWQFKKYNSIYKKNTKKSQVYYLDVQGLRMIHQGAL